MQKIIVILVEPGIPGNIGAVARVIKNFGCSDLRLVNPQTAITDDARRRAVHANDIIDSITIYPDIEAAIFDCDLIIASTARLAGDYNVNRTAITPRQLTETCQADTGTIGILFGRESSGLTNQELAYANIVVSIPTSDQYSSLNLSHAVAVILYELYLLRDEPPIIQELSTQKEKKLLLQFIAQITPFLNIPPYKERVLQKVFKNLIGRSVLSRRESNSLLGLFRRILVGLSMRQPVRPAKTIEVDDKVVDTPDT